MHIIGTAGHVDHGKSTLVMALTGHNPDRLIEEQRRGMTLDLGFAPLRFKDGVEAGIVDVPGHERFLHNMLAGAAGMELLLLVIAANEGPKPQTFEHLHILNFLNVSQAIVVITKVDLVDAQARELAVELARDACRDTIAANAPIVEVSTVTGEGINTLKSAIHDALVAMPARRPQAPPYMPVDRVFALPGHGTIVTGTLMQGSVSTGDTLALQPSGIRARLKSIQVFGGSVRSATGGTRVAVNLPGIEKSQISRGEALVAPREFEPVRELFIDFTALPSAIELLRRRVPVRVYIGSAEIPGQLRFAEGVPRDATPLRASAVLWRPTVVYPGQRIIIRRMSPKNLLGGGVVRSAAPDAAQTAITASAADEAAIGLEDAPPGTADVYHVIAVAGQTPLALAKIAAQANIAATAADTALSWLVEQGKITQLHKPVEYIGRETADHLFERFYGALRELHERASWRLGMTTADAATKLHIDPLVMQRLLAVWHDDGRIGSRAGLWHATDFAPTLTKTQQAFFERELRVTNDAPFQPHSHANVARAAAAASPETTEALAALVAGGDLVRVGDDLYRRSQIERAQTAIAELLSRTGQATMAQLRDVLGTSRKYALPLMEYFDSLGFTMRDGDQRRLRKAR